MAVITNENGNEYAWDCIYYSKWKQDSVVSFFLYLNSVFKKIPCRNE